MKKPKPVVSKEIAESEMGWQIDPVTKLMTREDQLSHVAAADVVDADQADEEETPPADSRD